MKRLCIMLLLIFGADSGETTRPTDHDHSNGTYFFYNNTGLTISEKRGTLDCSWSGSQCYVECMSVDIPPLTTSELKMTVAKENVSITCQSSVVVFLTCVQEIMCNITKCVSDLISKLINKSSNRPNVLKDLKRLTRIRKMCSELFATDNILKNFYIRAEKKYIDALISAPFTESVKNYDLEEVSMTVFKMDLMQPTDHGLIQISAPKVPDDDLSVNVFLPTKPFVNVSEEQKKIGIVTYHTANLFINDPKTVLKSKVIRVETVGHETKHLSDRLVINFTINRKETIITESQTLSCLFYNVDAAVGQEWNAMGSFTNLEHYNSSNTVSCSYDHMTPFAVLLVDMNEAQISPQQWKILSYISYIGCSLSALFSAVTIFLYAFMKKSKIDTSIHIHVSLSAALFLLNTSFMFVEWGATWSQDSVCVLIAVTIQYSLLSCFSWMAVEALHLYLLLIKVFNTYIKHYMVKLSLFGWGVPAVIVGGSLCVYGSTPFYGTTEVKLSDTNDTTKFCWITDRRFLYGMNITYFSFTFLFNTCILVTVTHQICKLRCLNIRGSKLPSCKDFCTVLGLTLLLGMTWGLAFLTSGYTNYPILYLFCICNTLQGLFIFLWFHTTIKKNRLQKAETTTVSEPASATVTCESSFTQ